MAELASARADFHDAPGRGFGKPPQFPADPALVSHEEIDPPQITPAPPRLRVIRRQMIQQFRDDDTFDHLRKLDAIAPITTSNHPHEVPGIAAFHFLTTRRWFSIVSRWRVETSSTFQFCVSHAEALASSVFTQ